MAILSLDEGIGNMKAWRTAEDHQRDWDIMMEGLRAKAQTSAKPRTEQSKVNGRKAHHKKITT